MNWSVSALMLMLLGVPQAGQPLSAEARAIELAQLTVRERIIVRVPVRAPRPDPRHSPIVWHEGRGPRCVTMRSIVGASLVGQNSVDLVLRNNSRIRARLEASCPALDYYYGFYITPSSDGRICADRDVIRSRMGGQCGIKRFRTLVPRARD